MSRRRHTPEQIITALREAEVGLANGKTVGIVSREPGGQPHRRDTSMAEKVLEVACVERIPVVDQEALPSQEAADVIDLLGDKGRSQERDPQGSIKKNRVVSLALIDVLPGSAGSADLSAGR